MARIVDLFCGCGGLSKGFEMAGFESVFAIDFWKDAIETYNNNHLSKVAFCQDIHKVTESFLSDLRDNKGVIGVVGGPPCQGFSTVGKREGDDPRNSLYLEYVRVVKTLMPRFFVLENVKGLLTLDKGFFRDDIIKTFTQLGYNVSYKVLNASDFGVPQNRERVFFVGVMKGNFKFPEPHDTQKLSSKDGISDLPSPSDSESTLGYKSAPQNDFQKLMRKNSFGVANHVISNHSEQTKAIIHLVPDGGRISDLPKEMWQVRKYNKAFERMSSSRPSNTVDTGHRNYFHFSEDRIPTVRENARLQSFPDTFVFSGSKTSQYKQVGNAVPPLLAYAVAKALLEQLINTDSEEIHNNDY